MNAPTIRIPFANLLRRIANWCHTEAKTKTTRSTMSLSRSNGAILAMCQWAVQAMLTKKTPHPGVKECVTVFIPQWDLKAVSRDDDQTRVYDVEALVTTMQYSSFQKLTGHIQISRRPQRDSRQSEWVVEKAEFKMTDWNSIPLEFRTYANVGSGQEKSHLEAHFDHYFERIYAGDNRAKA